ncbi:MAG: RNA polymerase sigma factor [Bacteroidales bacterium]|nr:RNA polymerase sigma factor [Bacteroidales bacterium]MDD4602321.1 RNA polymerase sigma factor [Bacteroidales bacterium]
MLIDDSIIEGCVKGKRSAQSALYRKFAPVMMALCLRYAKDYDEAEDIMQEAFLKILQKIGTYRQEGSFEGWMKRIMINHALNYYRKNSKLPFHENISEINELEISDRDDSSSYHAPIAAEKLIALIQTLPPGYRMVFNLYVFEGFSHKEIADSLKVSENTSKTQLLKARRMLQKKLADLNIKNE